MTRWLACLVPWMATTAALAAQTAATVQYSYQGSSNGAIRIEDRCFITPKTAKSWGWNVALRGDDVQIACEGRLFRVPFREINGQRYFDLTESARYIGAKARWENNQYQLLGSIRSIELTDNGVEVASTIKVQPKSFRLTNPDRLVIDFYGADLEHRLVKDLPSWFRVAQFQKDVVRLVVEHPAIKAVDPGNFISTRQFGLVLPNSVLRTTGTNPGTTKTQTDTITNAKTVQDSNKTTTTKRTDDGRGAKPKSSDPINPVIISTPIVAKESNQGNTLTFQLSRKPDHPPAIRYVSPTQLQLTLRGGQILELAEGQIPGTRWIKSYAMAGDVDNAVIFLETEQAMAFKMSTVGASIKLELFRPPINASSLSGRVIVVDAGHGGRDSGAKFGKTYEKEINLRVSKAITEALTRAGASVIMTRDDDSFPSLADRPSLANNSNADIFISTHANSNTVVNSRSGTITFFHKQDPVCRLLAECLHAEIVKATAIPDIGVWSDQRIYNSGFKVLREASMPAVLLELGFVNHSFDRAEMTKKDYADKIANAVVQGIRVFLGEKE